MTTVAAPQPGDRILVYMLGEQPLGEQFRRKRLEWPLHITLVPWFSVTDEQGLLASIGAFAARERQLEIALGGVEHFNAHTEVTLVAEQVAIHQLHDDLLAAVRAGGGEPRNLQWTGPGYRAHVTHHDNQPIPAIGLTLRIESFALVRLLDGDICEVERNFILGAPIETAA